MRDADKWWRSLDPRHRDNIFLWVAGEVGVAEFAALGDEVTVSADSHVHSAALVEMGARNGWVPSGVAWKCVAADRPAVLRIEDAMEGDGDAFADCPGVAITVDVEMGGLVDLVMTTVPLSALEAIVEQAKARR